MTTPKQMAKVLSNLRTYCPDVNPFNFQLVNNDPAKEGSLNNSLNLFLVGVGSEQDEWILSGKKLDAYRVIAPNYRELMKVGLLQRKGNNLKATKLSVEMYCQKINELHPNHTEFDSNGDLAYKLSIEEGIIHRAIRHARYTFPKNKRGREVVVETGGEGAALQIGRLRILKFFHLTYTQEQICLHGMLDEGEIILIAKYGKHYHMFTARYDKENDLYGPFYFFGVILS